MTEEQSREGYKQDSTESIETIFGNNSYIVIILIFAGTIFSLGTPVCYAIILHHNTMTVRNNASNNLVFSILETQNPHLIHNRRVGVTVDAHPSNVTGFNRSSTNGFLNGVHIDGTEGSVEAAVQKVNNTRPDLAYAAASRYQRLARQ